MIIDNVYVDKRRRIDTSNHTVWTKAVSTHTRKEGADGAASPEHDTTTSWRTCSYSNRRWDLDETRQTPSGTRLARLHMHNGALTPPGNEAQWTYHGDELNINTSFKQEIDLCAEERPRQKKAAGCHAATTRKGGEVGPLPARRVVDRFKSCEAGWRAPIKFDSPSVGVRTCVCVFVRVGGCAQTRREGVPLITRDRCGRPQSRT
jgi:hypothetical protein